MPHRWILRSIMALTLGLLSPQFTHASTGDLGAIIEGFVTRHFPEATSHLWIVNDTQWDGDEMVVDVHTIVMEKQQTEATVNRYLLLIVEGKLAAAQRVPLEDGPDCKPEEA
ncbi:hypothetical protein [Nitrospira moscoviensis]|uniref:Uncharacterized protein n=1 Tax=Nitrospira moscoviensis TaxID=42253 RepID=A0A0K2GIU8_NITMO|nr:hypothetical protein [Nitrospira moscoviensis]ALA60865.1 conserved exported protein of unknown function [Nitrospira moscoviensis]